MKPQYSCRTDEDGPKQGPQKQSREDTQQPVQSAYPVGGVEPCRAATDDADVERLAHEGGEAPRRRPLDKQRPQPLHRAGEEPQTAGHLVSAETAGAHTTRSRTGTQWGDGGGDVEARLRGGGEVSRRPDRSPLSRLRCLQA